MYGQREKQTNKQTKDKVRTSSTFCLSHVSLSLSSVFLLRDTILDTIGRILGFEFAHHLGFGTVRDAIQLNQGRVTDQIQNIRRNIFGRQGRRWQTQSRQSGDKGRRGSRRQGREECQYACQLHDGMYASACFIFLVLVVVVIVVVIVLLP